MKTLILILILLTSYQAKSQLQGQAKIDSLLKELPKMKEDTNGVNLLKSLSFEYHRINPDKGLKYGKQGLKLAEKIDWALGTAKCYNCIGTNNELKSNYSKALEYYHKALKAFEEHDDLNGVAISLGNIGIVYLEQSNYPKALDYYLKVLKIFEELENKSGIAASLGNIGIIYRNQFNYPRALEFFLKAIKIYEELGNKNGQAINIGNIAIVYDLQSNYPKALQFYHKALKINEELGYKSGIARNLGNIGDLYLTQAKDSIIEKSELKVQLLLNKEVNLNKAIDYNKKSIELCKEIGDLHSQFFFLRNLSQAYKLKGDYKNAYEAYKEYKELNDSVFSMEKSKEIANLENERKQLEAERIAEEKARIEAEKIAQRNRLQYLGIGAMVVGLGIILIITGRMKLKDWVSRALVFISLIFLFEFMLVLIDPWTDEISEGIPLIKFAINMMIAFIIFPIHQYLEKRVSKSIIKIE